MTFIDAVIFAPPANCLQVYIPDCDANRGSKVSVLIVPVVFTISTGMALFMGSNHVKYSGPLGYTVEKYEHCRTYLSPAIPFPNTGIMLTLGSWTE